VRAGAGSGRFSLLIRIDRAASWNQPDGLRLGSEGEHDETSAPTISASGSRYCGAPGSLTRRNSTSLPLATGALDRWVSGWGSDRHYSAGDGAVALRAARSASRRRQPGGGRQQYRRRRRRECAAGRLHASAGRRDKCDQRNTLREAQFQFHSRHRTGLRHHPRAAHHGGSSIGPGEDSCRVHRLCQSSPRQDQHGIGRDRDHAPRLRRVVQDDDGRRHASRTLPPSDT